MDKARKEIAILSLVLVGLLVVLLYSPVGSPEYYYPSTFISVNQNVGFNNNIPNAPKFNHTFQSSEDALLISTNRSSLDIESKYSFTRAVDNVGLDYTGQSNSSNRLNNNQTTQVESANGFAFGFSSGRGSSGAGSSTQNVGFIATSIDLASASSTSNKQASPYSPGGGGTDPGADPDHHQPIPITDGWIFLLFLACGYIVIKRFGLK